MQQLSAGRPPEKEEASTSEVEAGGQSAVVGYPRVFGVEEARGIRPTDRFRRTSKASRTGASQQEPVQPPRYAHPTECLVLHQSGAPERSRKVGRGRQGG